MRSLRTPLRTFSVLIAALAVVSCGEGVAPTAVQTDDASLAQISSTSLSRVAGDMPVFALEQVIGPEGGSVGIDGYRLYVPRGAVTEPTRFTFASVNSGFVQVELTATSLGSTVHNNVGAAGFRVPVSLALSYGSG